MLWEVLASCQRQQAGSLCSPEGKPVRDAIPVPGRQLFIALLIYIPLSTSAQAGISAAIARAPRNIPRANAVFPCWSCKMAEQFLSITPMAGRRAEGGQSSVELKASGESPHSLRRATACSSSTIPFPTRLRNGRATGANRRLPSGSYLTRPTALKALHVSTRFDPRPQCHGNSTAGCG